MQMIESRSGYGTTPKENFLLESSKCEIIQINLLDFQDDPNEYLVHALPELVTYRNGSLYHAYCGSNISQWISEVQQKISQN
jgi:hypothetical protein